MSTSNNTVPGMMYPTQKAMIGSTPADSARLTAINKSISQSNANKLMAGGKIIKKKYRGGDSENSIIVPQYTMPYDPQGGIGTNPNNQIQGNAQTSTQMAANSLYDNQATKMGGSRKKKGGNPDGLWGWMSGGKKRTKKYIKYNLKYRKTCKKRKHKKH